MKKLLLFALSIALAFTACKKDEEKDGVDPAQQAATDKQTMSTSMESVDDELDAILETEGMEAMASLSSFGNPIPMKKSTSANWIQRVIFPQIVGKSRKSTYGEPFAMEDVAATYTWNNSAQDWDVDNSTTDKIVVIFPSDSTKPDVNDATLTLSEYEEQEFTDDEQGTYYQPTSIKADLKVSSTLLIDVSVSAAYTDDATPNQVDGYVYIVPFKLSVGVSNSASSISASIDLDQMNGDAKTPIIGVGGQIVFDAEDNVTDINGAYFTYRAIQFKATIALADALSGMQTAEKFSDLNQYVSAGVYSTSSGAKMCDIKISDDMVDLDGEPGEEMPEILFVYADGSSESVYGYVEPLMASVEEDMAAIGSYLEGLMAK